MENILIATFDLEVGGVERSLISMLHHFNYQQYKVDLMLYSHSGDFLEQLPTEPELLQESARYKTFRMSIKQIFQSGYPAIGVARLLAKLRTHWQDSAETGYQQMQYMWKYALPFLPKLDTTYDVAVSYLWPHYFVAEKVAAKVKIAWIHTDFSSVDTNEDIDIKMWRKFDHIVAVSEECKKSFIHKYPLLQQKVLVMENVTSPDLIRSLATVQLENPMLDDTRFKIITVARLSHAKGIDQAVRALKLLKEKGYRNLAWYVVGYGGDERMLRELIADASLQEAFILLGKKVNPYPFIKAADLYVQPSRYEGKAVTVGEAQILAKPVLITNYPTAPSQVNDGQDGRICESSIAGIATGIQTLYEHPEQRNQLAEACANTDYANEWELEKLYQIV
ncbi:glycosyltransferase [Gracilibacillus phocaeensis]|uniref:glycosyltransferase n=1 Tax=Gracilibacillus phocaeensis TaxID=2042304 RepID=UPI00102F97DA|nr:glycosyltransferase [Gracilibacillus phocaeensis]